MISKNYEIYRSSRTFHKYGINKSSQHILVPKKCLKLIKIFEFIYIVELDFY